MIYICTHTDFDLPEQIKDGYIILSTKQLDKEYNIPVEIVQENKLTSLQYSYAEGYHIYHLWKTCKEPWIGINQYRKYFFNPKQYRTILPKPKKYNMYEQYKQAHNIKDLDDCLEIIDKYYPEYKCDYKSIQLQACNMFVMRQYDFHKYCEFIFGVLNKFNEKHNLKTYDDVYRFIESRQSEYDLKYGLKYQTRLHGYLFERLSTIFFNTYFKVEIQKIAYIQDKIE